MLPLFSALRSFVIRKTSCVNVDGLVFRLHYKWTSLVLLVFSIVVCSYQLLGNPIMCNKSGSVPEKFIDTVCWIETTFSLPEHWEGKIGKDISYPGIANSNGGEKRRVYHAYYQWVAFVLVFQAMLFYVPHYFWKVREGKRLKHIILKLNDPVLSKEEVAKNRTSLRDYLLATWSWNTCYAASYIAAEVFNLVNVICQLFLTHVFLGRNFSPYGVNIIEYAKEKISIDPMVRIFPLQSKCLFYKFGSSGNIETIDVLCLLPINVMNSKIYTFLWFWFVGLAVVTSASLILRLVSVALPFVRYILLLTSRPSCNKKSLEEVVSRASYGDWFLVYLLSRNIHRRYFEEVIDDLSDSLKLGKYRMSSRNDGKLEEVTEDGLKVPRLNSFYKDSPHPDLCKDDKKRY